MRPKIIPEYVRLRERDETRRDVSGPIKGSIRTEEIQGIYRQKRLGLPQDVTCDVISATAGNPSGGDEVTTYVYVDNSNIYIEGCRVAAVKKGLAKTIYEAMDTGIVDHTWNLDYGKLYDFICGTDAVARLWGSPPPGDTFWNMLHRKGFNPTVYEKNASNKEKKVDTAIAGRMTKDAYTILDKQKDEILLVSGDSDYVPVVADLVSEGFKVEVAFWDHASGELKRACTKFIALNQYHDHFTR